MTSPDRRRPLPAWARWGLALVPLGDRRPDVEADFAELFADRVGRYGALHAHRRLLGDIVSLARGRTWGGHMLRDVRFGLRLCRRYPAPIAVTVAGLALAIGAVTSVFSLINATMLRPFGMDDPASVVSVTNSIGHGNWRYWPYARVLDLQREASLVRVEAMSAERVRFSTSADGDADRSRFVLFVTGGYLDLFGGRPLIGRALQPSDDRDGAPPVVVISHDFWSGRLGADPAVVGSTIWLDGSPVTVVGILQPAFTGPTKLRPAFWAPIAAFDEVTAAPAFGPQTTVLVEAVGRLAPGVERSAARDNLAAVAARLAEAADPATAGRAVRDVDLFSAASPVDGPDAAESYLGIAAMLAIIGLVLALACANTAILLLAGAATRAREIGVRLALGSTRGRLVRQLTAESLLLSAVAGALGVLLSVWIAPLVATVMTLPEGLDTSIDGRVLLFAIVVVVICGLGAGLSPARFGARGDVLSAIRAQGGPRGGAVVSSRLRRSFVVFQAAVSMLLLVSAALLARTALESARIDVGFDVDKVLTVDLADRRQGFDEATYLEAATAALRRLPGVERVSTVDYLPFGWSVWRTRLSSPEGSFTLQRNGIDADFFDAMGMRLVAGRTFTPEEVARQAPVAVVSERVARLFFGNASPIGISLTALPAEAGITEHAVIIGVVSDAMTRQLDTQAFGSVYWPLRAMKRSNPPGLVVRVANPGSAARRVEDVLRGLSDRVRPSVTMPADGLGHFQASQRMLAWLAGPTAGLALILAALGVFGLTAFVVGQRTHEASVRKAVGASTADVLRLFAGDSLRPVALGVLVGLAAGLAIARVFSSVLPGISPQDPVAIVAAAATMIAVALVAVVVPARRVARTDPARMLRQE